MNLHRQVAGSVFKKSREDGVTRRSRDNLVSGGIALGSAAFLIWIIPAFTPPYPGYGVSSALLPNLAVGLILVLSLLSLLRNMLRYLWAKSSNPGKVQPEGIREDDRVHLWFYAGFMIPCILLMPAMKWMGFIPGGLLFMLLIQYLCGQRKPIAMVLVAVVSVGSMYAVMRYGLNVPMP